MKQQVNPVVAAVVIIAAICAAGFVLWYGNRDKPIPDKFVPPSQRQAEAMQRMGMGGPGGGGGAPAGMAPGGRPGGPPAGQPAAKPGEKPAEAKTDAKPGDSAAPAKPDAAPK
jgi:hypothetical protein